VLSVIEIQKSPKSAVARTKTIGAPDLARVQAATVLGVYGLRGIAG
jgi:hypothetical protein